MYICNSGLDQAINWSNPDIDNWTLSKKLWEIWIEIHKFSFMKMPFIQAILTQNRTFKQSHMDKEDNGQDE